MYDYQSVALVLTNREGRFLCVRELQSKPAIGKIVGLKDYSFPWETRESKDGTHEDLIHAVHRAIVEEVDGTDRVNIEPPVYIGHVDVHDSTAHVFVAQFQSGPEIMRGTHAGSEIEPLGWLTREELLTRCRDGVRGILALYDQYQHDCQCC